MLSLSFFNRAIKSVYIPYLLAFFITFFQNTIFIEKSYFALGEFDFSNILFFCSMIIVLFCVMALFFSLFNFKYIIKPFAVIILLINSGIYYFSNTYNVLVDKVMLRNVIGTDQRETLDLMTFKMFLTIFILGVLPSILLCLTNIKYDSFFRNRISQIKSILLLLFVIVVNVFSLYNAYSSFFRSSRHIKYNIVPVNYISSAVSVLSEKSNTVYEFEILDDNVQKGDILKNNGKRTIFVMALGETARSANFSLNGYSRDTNEPLNNQNVISYSNFYSCGTSTAVSVPCMYSIQDRSSLNVDKTYYQENLLDLIQKSGFNVLWRNNNNGGCKGVCNRVPTEDLSQLKSIDLCVGKYCKDEILLQNLGDYIKKTTGDIFINIHMLGSHGPAYYARTSDEYKKFKPECESNNFSSCDLSEIVNAYDNTIYYTSVVLNKFIEELKKYDDSNTALLYVSDHGESLGEYNLFLHGAPYILAPEEQKKVPYILWLSDNYKNTFNIDTNCLLSKKDNEYSQDNVFSSLLGILGIKTKVYDKDKDMFAACMVEK